MHLSCVVPSFLCKCSVANCFCRHNNNNKYKYGPAVVYVYSSTWPTSSTNDVSSGTSYGTAADRNGKYFNLNNLFYRGCQKSVIVFGVIQSAIDHSWKRKSTKPGQKEGVS